MAMLDDTERGQVSAEFNRNFDETTDLLRSEVRILINSADQFLDDNSSVYNSLIPQPVRSKASAREKVRALVHVLNRRFNLGL